MSSNWSYMLLFEPPVLIRSWDSWMTLCALCSKQWHLSLITIATAKFYWTQTFVTRLVSPCMETGCIGLTGYRRRWKEPIRPQGCRGALFRITWGDQWMFTSSIATEHSRVCKGRRYLITSLRGSPHYITCCHNKEQSTISHSNMLNPIPPHFTLTLTHTHPHTHTLTHSYSSQPLYH